MESVKVNEVETENAAPGEHASVAKGGAASGAGIEEDATMKEAKVEKTLEKSDSGGIDESCTANVPAWDHSNRKVIVRNTLKFMRAKEVDKVVQSWLSTLDDPSSIRITKTKKAPNQPWIQLTLEHEDMVQPFLDHINTSNIQNGRGATMHAVCADSDRIEDNRKRENDSGNREEKDAKRRKPSGPKTDDEVRDAITPMWRQSYEKQLLTKQREMIRKCALKIVQEVKGKFRNIEKESRLNKNREVVPVYDWVKGKKAVEVKPILPSPIQTEYRNKCEMNFGYRYDLDVSQEDTNEALSVNESAEDGQTMKKIPSVGFLASGWAGGVSRPHILANIPSEACAIADVINEFLRDSPTEPYDSTTHRGLWRVMTIRISRRTRECMVIVMHAPPSGGLGAKDETDDYSGVFESEKARLVSMLTDNELSFAERDYEVIATDDETTETNDQQESKGSPSSFRVTSVYFQEYAGVSNPTPEHPVQVSFRKFMSVEKDSFGAVLTFLTFSLSSSCVACIWEACNPRTAGEVHISDIPRSVLPGKHRGG